VPSVRCAHQTSPGDMRSPSGGGGGGGGGGGSNLKYMALGSVLVLGLTLVAVDTDILRLAVQPDRMSSAFNTAGGTALRRSNISAPTLRRVSFPEVKSNQELAKMLKNTGKPDNQEQPESSVVPSGDFVAAASSQTDGPAVIGSVPTRKELLDAIKAARSAIASSQEAIRREFPVPEKLLGEVRWYDTSGAGMEAVVGRLARAMLLRDTFVFAMGGMSDTAGHGNFFEESYTMVMGQLLEPAMLAAGIGFQARNMAMGGVPSFPSSLCMQDSFGKDVDIVGWDYRMVERDAIKGEIFLRQALMHPRRPFVMFKRQNDYLNKMERYYGQVGLHAIDERELQQFVNNAEDGPAADILKDDKFCRGENCPCPGKVRWHSKYKLNRLRAGQMAMVYLGLLQKAVEMVNSQLNGQTPLEELQQRARTSIVPLTNLPPRTGRGCATAYCDTSFRCATTWRPTTGLSIEQIQDKEQPTRWALKFPDGKAERVTKQGHQMCHYQDSKQALVGDAESAWVFFKFTTSKRDSTMVICLGVTAEDIKDWTDDVIVLLNGEEIEKELKPWLSAKTLGVVSTCYGYKGSVLKGPNTLGIRVMDFKINVGVTHIMWEE